MVVGQADGRVHGAQEETQVRRAVDLHQRPELVHLQTRLVLRVVVELVGHVRQVVADAAAHGTVISWHTGALEAAAARPASCARSSSSSEGGADGSGRAIAPSLPSSPAARAGPAQAGETGIRASLSADLCGAGTGNLLVSFSSKEIRPKINCCGRALPPQGALSSSLDRAGEGRLGLRFQGKDSLKKKVGEKNCNHSQLEGRQRHNPRKRSPKL